MANLAAKKSNLISCISQRAVQLLTNIRELRDLKTEYDALALTWSNVDFAGDNDHMTAAEFTAAAAVLDDFGPFLALGTPSRLRRLLALKR